MKTVKTLLISKKENTKKSYDYNQEQKSLSIGKWYKDTQSDFKRLVYISGEGNKIPTGYGFDNNRDWTDSIQGFALSSYTLDEATDKEVEEALIKEAKKRGFKKGVKCKRLDNFYYGEGDDEIVGKITYDGNLSIKTKNDYNFGIFKNGIWAEIIEESVPTIAGYKMEEIIEGWGKKVKFGCAEFEDVQLKDIYRNLMKFGNDNYYQSNRTIKSITLSSDVTITIEQLKEIADYLNLK